MACGGGWVSRGCYARAGLGAVVAIDRTLWERHARGTGNWSMAPTGFLMQSPRARGLGIAVPISYRNRPGVLRAGGRAGELVVSLDRLMGRYARAGPGGVVPWSKPSTTGRRVLRPTRLQRYHVRTPAQLVQVVCPVAHHRAPPCQVKSMVVGSACLVAHLVG